MQDSESERHARRGPPRQFDRVEVLDRLVDLFWRKGFVNTSHAEMKAVTGLSGSSLYNTFGDKASIFDQVLARYQELSYVLVEPLLEGTGGLDDIISWIEFLKGQIASADTPPGCLMMSTLGTPIGLDPGVQRHTRENVMRVKSSLEVVLARAAAVDEIRIDEIGPVAELLTATYIGVLTVARPNPKSAIEMLGGVAETVGSWAERPLGS